MSGLVEPPVDISAITLRAIHRPQAECRPSSGQAEDAGRARAACGGTGRPGATLVLRRVRRGVLDISLITDVAPPANRDDLPSIHLPAAPHNEPDARGSRFMGCLKINVFHQLICPTRATIQVVLSPLATGSATESSVRGSAVPIAVVKMRQA